MHRSLYLLLPVFVVLVAPGARAQSDGTSALEELDPGALDPDPGPLPPLEDPPPAPAPATAPARRTVRPDQPRVTPAIRDAESGPARVDPAAAVDQKGSKRPTGPEVPPQDPGAAKPATAQALPKAPGPVIVPTATDEDLIEAWTAWRRAHGADRKAAEAAWARLTGLKQQLGISNLEAFSVAAARASAVRLERGDLVGAIELASAAVELAPELPWAHFALARAYFGSDLTDVARWGAALKETVRTLAADPRYVRPAVADFFAALTAALIATAIAVVGVLFARRVRYFLHDFHHLFPRTAARWQTVPLALVLLSLPVVFRLGLIPVLLMLLASVALYLSWRERVVAASMLAVVGLTPLLAEAVIAHTAFAGTPAENVYLLERGGTGADAAARAVQERIAKGQGSYVELFALGRYQYRRGQLDASAETFKKAALENGNDPRLWVNVGNIRFGLGDIDGAAALYNRAAGADEQMAEARYNLARVHYRRAATLADAAATQEIEKAKTAQMLALQMAPELGNRPEIPLDGPQPLQAVVVSPGLAWEEVAPLATLHEAPARVAGQLSERLVGTSGALAWILPALLAALVAGLGLLAGPLSASRVCDRCGRAVCRRCDPELGPSSGLCGQCVNVFTKKGVVAPQVKVRKQLEVDRYRNRLERLGWLLGILCSGGGHLFGGRPLRGAAFAFVFLFCIFVGVFREGILRAPFGELPVLWRLVPSAVVLLVVYYFSLRSLRKAQVG